MNRAHALTVGTRRVADGLGRLRQGTRAVWHRSQAAIALRGLAVGGHLAHWGSHLTRPALLRQGLAAADRGNMDAAFALLREAAERRPEHVETSLAFWWVAVGCDRTEDAVEAMTRVVQTEAASARKPDAVAHWIALMTEAPAAVVDPASVGRLIPELKALLVAAGSHDERDHARAWLVSALRQCLDPRGGALTPGLALRVFEESRPLEPELARRAAEVVLGSPDLHETKRSRIESLLAALDDPLPLVPSGEHSAEDEREPAFTPPLVVIEAAPVELADRALLLLEIESEQRTRVDFRAIEAISVAEVDEGGTSVLLVDLVLQRARRRGPRRVLRLRPDRFDPHALFPELEDAGEALRALLSELLERTHAIPLPDPDSALGLRPRHFDSVEAYENDVLEHLRG